MLKLEAVASNGHESGVRFMRLSSRSLGDLAKMVCGDQDSPGDKFRYRSSSKLTEFFRNCGMNYAHDGSTRAQWVQSVLEKLNLAPSSSPDLPPGDIRRVLTELMDPMDFETDAHREAALKDLNKVLGRDSLVAYFDAAGRTHIRNDGTGASSSLMPNQPRPLSKDELEQRAKLAAYLDSASEDEFIESILVPLFQRLGFHRVTAPGHKEKALEFGKDLYMKFQLPTGHWLYFCAQVKRDKLDARGVTGGINVAEVLNQAKMAIDNPIFDNDTNRKVLLDHLFIISSADITRAARAWIVEKLDKDQRRHIIFMDRDEFLNHAARILIDLNIPTPNTPAKPDPVDDMIF